MFTKILVLTVIVTIASCSDRHYLKHTHQPHKEYRYRHPYEHHQIQVQEPSSEEYQPEHGHAYSSQNIVHQGQTAANEESHESEHVTPVYQYKVNEPSEDAPVEPKYPAHYPQHEIQVPHHKTAYYYPESQEHKEPAYHHTESHEGPKEPAYQHHEAPVPAYYHPESHKAPQKVHYQPESHEPAYHPVPVHHAPIQSNSHESHDEPIDYYAYPKYQYEYKVEDPHTGDNKFQHEVRDGDVVKGVYGLHEADGSIRTVEYSSDKHHGFTAVVKHSAPGQHVHIESHHENEHQN